MIRVTLALFFGSAPLLPAQVAEQPTASTAAQLAALTSSLLPRRAAVSLEIQNLTPIPPAEWSSFRTLLQDELRKAGLETTATPEWRVRVTLSRDPRGLLLVTEVSSGDNRQVAMLPWNLPSSAQSKPKIAIAKKLLRTDPDPILDILLLDSNSQMLVLSADKVVSYRFMGDQWTPSATSSLVLPRPLPRDPRGRLAIAPGGFRAYLPGSTCTGAFQPQFKLTCAPGNENWPGGDRRWVTDRNLLQSDTARTPFYTVANGFYTTAGGRVQDRSGQVLAGAEAWGSDIAGIEDPCGGAAIVASANSDREEIRVYEVANGEVTLASDALPLPGPVTALWPAESPGEATLVVRNLQTGQYEVSRLGLACTQ